MGSITSAFKKPKKPKIKKPKVVIKQVTSSATETDAATQTSDTSTADAGAGTPTEDDVSQARTENLLKRSRGRTGTILTSFTGILEPNDVRPSRKSLLGE